MRASSRTIARVALAVACLIGAAPVPANATIVHAADTAGLAARVEPWVGVYRLVFADRSGMMMDARVVVEPNGDGLVGLLLVGEQASGISNVRIEAGELRAVVVTAEGRGALVLRNDADAIGGTLTIGKRVWTISGARAI